MHILIKNNDYVVVIDLEANKSEIEWRDLG